MGGRVDHVARRVLAAAQGEQDPEALRKVSRDFAAIFYSVLLREMQKSVKWTEDAGPMEQGVENLISLYLPGAIAQSQGDPLARQIYRHFKTSYGDPSDGRT